MKKVEFVSNGKKLKGTLFFPDHLKEKNSSILFVHGWTSERKRSYQYAEGLVKIGYICFVFDMTGHGESEGDRNNTTIREFLKDSINAYDFLKSVEGVDEDNISVAGNSFGCYLAAILTTKRKIKRLSLRVPADYPDDVFDKSKSGFSGDINPWIVEWRRKPKKPSESFALESVSNFEGSVLIIESEKDHIVPKQTIKNYINAVKDKNKVSHIIMKNAPHSIREGPLRDKVEEIMVEWFGKT